MVETRAMHVERETVRDSDPSVKADLPSKSKKDDVFPERSEPLSQNSQTISDGVKNSETPKSKANEDSWKRKREALLGSEDLEDDAFARFACEEAMGRYEFFDQRRFIVERVLKFEGEEELQDSEMKSIIKKNDMELTVTNLPRFCSNVVWEFYSHLPSEKWKGNFINVFVRGRQYILSPDKINELFGLESVDEDLLVKDNSLDMDEVASYLSESKCQKFGSLTTTLLSKTFSDLYSILCSNWMPTTNSSTIKADRAKLMYKMGNGLTFDFGKIVYQEILVLGTKKDPKFHLLYPAMIYKLLESQGFDRLLEDDLFKHPGNFNELKIKREVIVKKVTTTKAKATYVRKTPRLTTLEKGKTIKKNLNVAKGKVDSRKKKIEIEELSTDEDDSVPTDSTEYEEFVFRIPKSGSAANVCHALRAGLQTFQTVINAIAKPPKSKKKKF